MNSIRRARRRPRVVSVSFRTFAWVLLREAALAVLVGESSGASAWSVSRSYLAKVDGARCRQLVFRQLTLRPSRRFHRC